MPRAKNPARRGRARGRAPADPRATARKRSPSRAGRGLRPVAGDAGAALQEQGGAEAGSPAPCLGPARREDREARGERAEDARRRDRLLVGSVGRLWRDRSLCARACWCCARIFATRCSARAARRGRRRCRRRSTSCFAQTPCTARHRPADRRRNGRARSCGGVSNRSRMSAAMSRTGCGASLPHSLADTASQLVSMLTISRQLDVDPNSGANSAPRRLVAARWVQDFPQPSC